MEIISEKEIKNKINDQKKKIRTELSDFTIACPYCGEAYHRVAQHAKLSHGIEIPTFRETYYYTTATGALADKILTLYAPRRDRYIQQYTYFQKDGTLITDYRTNNKELDWDKYLTPKKLISHIRGTQTYGGLFYPSASKVLIFDIDSYIESIGYFFNPLDPWCIRFQRAQASTPTYFLISALEEIGIPEEYIHILYSGAKGFHIVLFFDEFMDIRTLLEFGNFIINKTKSEIFREWGKPEEWEDLAKFSIELRPEGRNGRGVKFPLGIHLSTGERMEFCFNRHYYPPVSSQYDYLLKETNQIEKNFFKDLATRVLYEEKKKETKRKNKAPSAFIADLPSAAPTENFGGAPGWVPHNIGLAANNHRKCKHYSREELQQLYSEGLKEPATRHNVMLGLAILFKERGFSRGETFKKLLDFSREKLNGYSKSTEEQIKKDIGQIVRYTYERDYHLAKEEDTRWLLTDTDIRRIANYPFLSLNERITLVFIFILRRKYGKDAYYPIPLIAEWTSFCYRTIQNHIQKFITLGIIEKTYQGNSWNKTSNKYEIKDFQETYITALEFNDKDMDRELFVKGLLRFTPEELISTTYSPHIRKKWIDPVQIEDIVERKNPKYNELKREKQNPQRKVDGAKIFDPSFFKPIIAVFKWVRKMKKKHGADFAKIYPSFVGAKNGFIGKRGYYMRC